MLHWLKELRDKEGMTQIEMAKKVGITQQQYNYIENGKRGVTVGNAKKIAAVLGFEWTRFFEDGSDAAN